MVFDQPLVYENPIKLGYGLARVKVLMYKQKKLYIQFEDHQSDAYALRVPLKVGRLAKVLHPEAAIDVGIYNVKKVHHVTSVERPTKHIYLNLMLYLELANRI